MTGRDDARLDPRAWLVWGAATSLPPLLGRNPFAIVATLLAALGVRAAWSGATPRLGSWRGLVRLAAVFAAFGVAFNLLTAHYGDRVIGRLPGSLPLLGGALTLNALVYGLLSGLALFTLVLVGTTLGAVLDWPALLRLLPERVTAIAVAGSIAIAFVPQTAAAWGEIREAQAARGHRPRGVRDLVPLVVPLLTGGLERAITLAEALESRGFGAPIGPGAETARRQGHRVLGALGLTAAATGGYLLATGRPAAALAALAGAALGLTAAGREPRGDRLRRTRYRPTRWARADAFVAAAAGLTLLGELLTLATDPAAFRYEPYPSMAPPHVALGLLAALALLLAPVAVAPADAADATAGEEAAG